MGDPFPLDPKEMAEAIDTPLEQWPGNCHAIATAVRDLLPVQGMRIARGHYHGPVSRNSVYKGGHSIQHSWLVAIDGRILDPTRWCIASPSRPFIYLGLNDFYDEGARFLHARMSPALLNGPDKWLELVENLSGGQRAELATILGTSSESLSRLAWRLKDAVTDDPSRVPDARKLYAFLKDARRSAVIPIDSWQFVMEPEKLYCREGANRTFSLPPAPEYTETEILSAVFNRFLSIEERPDIEDELEEFGYTLEGDLWKSLNELEALKGEPIEYLPRGICSTLSVIAGDLLGRGFGETMRVERFVASMGVDAWRFDEILKKFGARGGYMLGWDVPEERQPENRGFGIG